MKVDSSCREDLDIVGEVSRARGMDKIVIIGSPGAGKSTFARELGKALHIEVFHLDRHFWQVGWKELPRDTRIEIEQAYVRNKQQWIIEGTYLGSSDKRLNAADTIIFLDMPRLLCLWRIIKRHMETHHQQGRLDIPDGCTDKLSLRCILKVLVFPHRGRKDFLNKVKCIGMDATSQSTPKKMHSLRSTRDVQAFLQSLSSQNQEKLALKGSIEYKHVFSKLVAHVRFPRNFCLSIAYNFFQWAKSFAIKPFEHSSRAGTN